jgi:uncharacterized protein YjiS (DUF1127 family)
MERTMLIGNLIGVLRTWLREDAGLSELSRLTDRELADLGLTRWDIDGAAWLAARTACAEPASLLRHD